MYMTVCSYYFDMGMEMIEEGAYLFTIRNTMIYFESHNDVSSPYSKPI